MASGPGRGVLGHCGLFRTALRAWELKGLVEAGELISELACNASKTGCYQKAHSAAPAGAGMSFLFLGRVRPSRLLLCRRSRL